jgi:cystathionine beta-lyase family protein involved in aluminum resistance
MEQNAIENYLAEHFHISKTVIDFVEKSEKQIEDKLAHWDHLAEYHQFKVIQAMQKANLSDRHFHPSTGYGYDDEGREATEAIFADVFGCEAALVRPQITCGTHAISLCLYGILRPGDELLAISGDPYDTVRTFIGANGEEKGKGTLTDFGVHFSQIELKPNGVFDDAQIMAHLSEKTKMVYIQRSTGYSWRKAITLSEIQRICQKIKSKWPEVVIFVDNCYGEFLDEKEPVAVGADLMAGSLIKNPGGGLAPTGGYVAGRSDLVALCANRLAAPGIGGETGATLGITRTFLQGFFQAPYVVSQAMKTALLVGKAYKNLGFPVCPDVDDYRSDIIQSVRLGDPKAVEVFCQAVQKAAPVDSFVTPVPWDMPGYDVPVIMAAGAFIQGSSIELSADAPMREPYIVYFQGGLTHAHGKLGLMLSLQELMDSGFIPKEKLNA